MKTIALAAALIVSSFSALADGATYRYPEQPTSSLTRAEVSRQAIAAADRGQTSRGEASYVAPTDSATALTRSEVRAELAQARANGQLPAGERVFVPELHSRMGMGMGGASVNRL